MQLSVVYPKYDLSFFFFDSVSRRNILNANHNYNFTKSQLRRHKSVMGVRVCILYMISLYLKQFACHLSRDNVVNQQKKIEKNDSPRSKCYNVCYRFEIVNTRSYLHFIHVYVTNSYISEKN